MLEGIVVRDGAPQEKHRWGRQPEHGKPPSVQSSLLRMRRCCGGSTQAAERARVLGVKQSMSNVLRLGRSIRLGGSLVATATFFRRQLWAWPILAAVVLGGVGWWVHGSVEGAMRRQMDDELTTTLKADVTSLRTWMGEQESNARILAASEYILPRTRELLAVEARGGKLELALLQSRALGELRDYIGPRLKIFGYVDFFVVSPSAHVLASAQDAAVGMTLQPERAEFARQVLQQGASVCRPFRSSMMLPDEQGQLRAGLPTMFTAAPITDEQGKPLASLSLRIRPEGKFTEILQVARPGQTGETYAFDRSGLFLSQSRFDDGLKAMGLLADQPDVHSILTLEVRDPQVNMAAGERPSQRRAEQSLTRMAADAVAGNSGVDVSGYRDYRGVPTVGAWTWLPEYDFGMATEQDVAEAYRPLYLLRVVFWSLMALLGLAAIAILVFMMVVARQQLAVRKAVLEARRLGQYTLEEKIGAGGMGSVYRARHALLRRPTAIKLLEPDKVSDLAIARFEREVQLTSQLNHPNTVAIYDFGRTPEGVFYYAMEYLDGLNLEDLIQRSGPLPEGRVVSILRQVCGSLAEAHGLGLVHRDIKPANIVLNDRGGVADFVKVLDFGLAKSVGAEGEARLTAANTLAGTPLYLAPEAVERPDTVDARADLYAVGAVGYFLLTATPVFRGNTIMEICMQHVRAQPEPPSQRLGQPVAATLEALLLKCLAKAPEDRPPSAKAILEELMHADPGSWGPAEAEAWWARYKGGSAAPSGPETEATAGGQTVAYPGPTA